MADYNGYYKVKRPNGRTAVTNIVCVIEAIEFVEHLSHEENAQIQYQKFADNGYIVTLDKDPKVRKSRKYALCSPKGEVVKRFASIEDCESYVDDGAVHKDVLLDSAVDEIGFCNGWKIVWVQNKRKGK